MAGQLDDCYISAGAARGKIRGSTKTFIHPLGVSIWPVNIPLWIKSWTDGQTDLTSLCLNKNTSPWAQCSIEVQ